MNTMTLTLDALKKLPLNVHTTINLRRLTLTINTKDATIDLKVLPTPQQRALALAAYETEAAS